MSIVRSLQRIPFIPYGVILYSGMSLVHALACERYIAAEFLYYAVWSGAIYGLVEYFMHRTLHVPPFKRIHDKHHHAPTKLVYIHVPVIIVPTMGWVVPYIFSYNLFDWTQHCIIWTFGPLYYMLFELTHKYSHTHRVPIARLKNTQSYHRAHHRDGNTNYGFTTPLWDIVFGTLSHDCMVSLPALIVSPIPFASFLVDGDAMFAEPTTVCTSTSHHVPNIPTSNIHFIAGGTYSVSSASPPPTTQSPRAMYAASSS